MAVRQSHARLAGRDVVTTNRVGVYPGSFNPPTVAHLALSEAAMEQRQLDQVVWSISRTALAKEAVDHPRFEHRLEVLESVAADVAWLEIAVTSAQLLVDVASGFDLLIMGADKWVQINEPHWYTTIEARDAAIAALPDLAIAHRPPHDVPAELVLTTDHDHHNVSSSRARDGAVELMLPPARVFAERTGAWIEVDRYDAWLTLSAD